MTRTWVDNITTLKGTNSITINTNNDLNLTGAAILSDNLNLNIAGKLNKKDLQDSYYSESMGFGLQVAVPLGGGKTTSTNNSNGATANGSNNSRNLTATSSGGSTATDSQSSAQPSPKGSTTISANYSQNEAKRTTYATIGGLTDYQNGTLALFSETKTMINGDFEGSLTVDHRLFSDSGRAEIRRELSYSFDMAKTPFSAAVAAYESDEDNKLQNFVSATKGASIANTRLFLNQNITTDQLAGDTKVIAYEGDSLTADSEAKTRNAFYDSNNTTTALNSSYTESQSDNIVAGKIAHESIGHKIGGESEFVASFVENTVKDNWSDFQSNNTNFAASLPQSRIFNNNYASSLNFEKGSGVYSDVAFGIDRDGAGGNGHMSAHFQDEFGYWYKYDQGMTKKAILTASPIGVLLNLGYEAGVDIKLEEGDKNQTAQNLINNPDVVYIRTTKEQDKRIFDAAFKSWENPGTYRLCTSNCVDAVQNIFSAGNVKYPIDFSPVPNSYFDHRLKPYYPNNKTNQSYDK